MAKPCQFCGSSTELNGLVNPKIKSWVLKTNELYPICEKCKPLNDTGDDTALVDLIQVKWKRIQSSRDEEKARLRASNQAGKALEIHNTIQKEVQNEQRT